MNLTFNNGIEIEGLEFLLDAHRKAEYSFVSHAHTDHIANHGKILATPETILFFRQRYKKPATRALGYRQKTKLNGFEIELRPSGHILGGAQIRLTAGDLKIVYTGDFKLQRGVTAPVGDVLKSDILIMESTYGSKQYVFPRRDRVIDQLISFVQKCLLSNQVPVILAYSLGKSQEAVKVLGDFGFEVYAEDNVYKFCKLYEKCGVKFENLFPLGKQDYKGKVVVFPPYFKKYRDLFRKIYRKRVCFLSGWALDNSSRFRTSADLTLPLSDHADYNELLEYVEKSDPKKIFTLHGFPEFAEDLRRRGYDAQYLGDGAMVSLTPESRKYIPVSKGNYDLFSD
ncbi:MAG: hypothetical protein GF404_03575 [candidate division Zixibacteria bacterium]|nr:hypothetical protein [candidate division Zixibacteria bacterium]